MNAYLNYFIESNIGLILFLLAYTLLLRNETDFKSKRVFLITGILTSLTFPLLHIHYNGTVIPSLSQVIPSYLLPEVIITANGEKVATYPAENIQSGWFYLQLLYIAGLTFFLIRFFIQVISLLRTITNSNVNRVGKFKIVEFPEDKPTFSFFNFIIVGQAGLLSAEEKQKIIMHETVHANQLHSFDILLLNVLGIFFWFNPLLKTYKKIFIQLHEFEADARAVENRDVNEYCSLLAKVALQSADFNLANHFNNSLTLKRIEMMKTIKRKIRPWKMLVVAGVIPLAFFIIACQDQLIDDVAEIAKSSTMAIDIPLEVQQKYDELTQAYPDKKFLLMETDETLKPKLDAMKTKMENLDQRQITHINLITPTAKPSEQIRTFAIIEYNEFTDDIKNRSKLDCEVFTMVEDTAVPAGGMDEFYHYIAKKLMYPGQARRMGIEGKVFIEFIVQTDGSITDVKAINGIGAGCDQEAVRVLQASGKWIPGKNKGVAVKQRMVLPITFALN
jgi:TonB family protein